MELGFLKTLFEHPGPWASVYVETTRATEDAAKQQHLRDRAVAVRLSEQGADATTREAVLDRLAHEPVSGAPPGRAIFAAFGEVVLDLPLTEPPPALDVSWSALPHIAPLTGLCGEDPVCLVAYIDRNGADLELRAARERRPAGQVDGTEWQARGHRGLPADRAEWRYRHKVENNAHRNAELVAAEIARQWPQSGAELLILAGDPRERSAVHKRLPDPLQAVTVEAEAGSRSAGASAKLLDREITQARERHIRDRLVHALDLFRAGRGRPGEHGTRGTETGPGEAAEGVPAVVDAIRSHQVATLLMAQDGPDSRREVWVGPGTDQVAVQRTQAHALGVSRPVRARADDALMRSAAAAGAEVLLVPEGVPGPAGGLGAVLRWSP